MKTILSSPPCIPWFSCLSIWHWRTRCVELTKIIHVPLYNPCWGSKFHRSIRGVPTFNSSLWRGKPEGSSACRNSVGIYICILLLSNWVCTIIDYLVTRERCENGSVDIINICIFCRKYCVIQEASIRQRIILSWIKKFSISFSALTSCPVPISSNHSANCLHSTVAQTTVPMFACFALKSISPHAA